MADELAVKIRGIYATALTHFFLNKGLIVAQPSEAVLRRFSNRKKLHREGGFQAEVRDAWNKQAIRIEAADRDLERIQALMTPVFWDAVYRRGKGSRKGCLEMEIPAVSKSILDELRREVKPTVARHHQLKAVSSSLVDLAENVNLGMYPERQHEISRDLEKRLLWSEYAPGKSCASSMSNRTGASSISPRARSWRPIRRKAGSCSKGRGTRVGGGTTAWKRPSRAATML